MNLEQITARHSLKWLNGYSICSTCIRSWPCDAIQAVGRVEELEAALRDFRAEVRLWEGEVIVPVSALSILDEVAASLPVREETNQ